MEISEIYARLSEPFHPKRVHWRLGSTNKEKTKGMPLAYIDARDVMERLDEVMGFEGWMDSYTETPSGRIICELTLIFFEEGLETTKSDGAGDTGFEGAKGAISDAFKRAAVKFGVGRYLYGIDSGWIDLENKRIPRAWLEQTAPKLLPTYKPSIYNDWRKFTDALMENNESILKMKDWLETENTDDAKAEWQMVSNEDKYALNRPWTKGGIWTPEETRLIKNW